MEEKRGPGVAASTLHILAMALMLCDHMWASLFPAAEWLTCLGRLAFPIFAFLLAEGYFHTGDLRRYLLRLLIGAVLSEIPFDLMYSGTAFYPFHQNVLWTFLLSLLLMAGIDRARRRFRPVPAALASAGLVLLGFAAGYAAMADYYGEGILTVLVFYFFHKPTWKSRLCQLVCLYFLNVQRLGGYSYGFTILGRQIELVQQGLALLALIPIWLYRGRQGARGRAFRCFCYAFYPLHMLALVLVRGWMLG